MSFTGPPTIPNIGIKGGVQIEEGMVFAIEPFATTGSGHVTEKTRREIYSQISPKPVRIPAGEGHSRKDQRPPRAPVFTTLAE